MPAKYWIKLYHEILDDPKMMRMDEVIFGRCIKLFLLAGKLNLGDGYLPSVEDIAWHLRLDVGEVQITLAGLEKANIVLQDDEGNWFVRRFAARNEAMDPADKMRRYRESQQHEEYRESMLPNGYAPVTKSNAESEADTEADQESESATAPEGDVTAAVAAAVGIGCDQSVASRLVDEYGSILVLAHAIDIRARNGLKNPAGFLISQLRNGVPAPPSPGERDRRRYVEGEYADVVVH